MTALERLDLAIARASYEGTRVELEAKWNDTERRARAIEAYETARAELASAIKAYEAGRR